MNTMTFNNRFMGILTCFMAVICIAAATETYPDYADEMADRIPENILPELYRRLMERKVWDNEYGIPMEHLMIRKSQRSPSLRLRFGRALPPIPTGALPRSNPGSVQDN